MPRFDRSLPIFYSKDPRLASRVVNPFDRDRIASQGNLINSNASVGIYNFIGLSAPTPVIGKSTNISSYLGNAVIDQTLAAVNFYDSAYDPNLDSGLQSTNNGTYTNLAISDPSLGRLATSGLPSGAEYNVSPVYFSNSGSTTAGSDDRVKIIDNSGKIAKSGSSILRPLAEVGGVIFPYTPTITISHRANYGEEDLIHTNYKSPYYKNSTVESINISGEFTASNTTEATYVAAMIHFFRSATKMFYGADSIAGTPPVVMRLEGHGNIILPKVPVVVTSFDYTLPNNVDYISWAGMYSASDQAKVPTAMTVTVNCKPVYSRNSQAQFGLEKFVAGNAISGGFI